ncbi:OBERON-like protein [Oryza sativa Japonica Group]|uniref:Oberon-like PHD finger domain-containing protein n=2 Tax=Oryza sativa subsp. japonica TaxID=39947 RepID=A0A8J8XW48_ORYSJ|nr:OBERON-like protein isoform X1 [Oryza sativa Japonica Group]ABA94920.1 Potyvirus VPg interacting protein, putative [Oryza sativa Japonica Group]EAZ19016.1 hypothetical protein OsJ_34548 [Oryza sativa Japonica Group]KAF2911829.1 hypothetical protein DAI22_11g209200 [Oryza sativa Japonica Group]
MAPSSRRKFRRKKPSQKVDSIGLQTPRSSALENQEPLLSSEYSGHNSAIQNIPEDLTVWDVVKGDVAIVASKMKSMTERLLEELKIALRLLMEDIDDQSHVEQLVRLQKHVEIRPDLTSATLLTAHHVQLEMFVALKMGIPAYLHENVSVPRSRLAEIFAYERCKNISCQSVLPAEECDCDVCCCRRGFCNLCMCVVCNGFDFDVNTCRWIGCDGCSHWTHAGCAIREEQIKTVITVEDGVAHYVTVFFCKACHGTSELLGWVRNVFQHCAKIWGTDALARELEYVQEVFSVSEDSKGKKLFEKCTDLIERLKVVQAESMGPEVLLQALQEIELDDAPEITENEKQVQQNTDPHETCNNQLSEYVQETAMTNKKVRLSVDAITDGEVEKAKEAEQQLQPMAAEQEEVPPPPASSSGGVAAPTTQNAMLCKILDALSGMPSPPSSESAAAVSKVHELLREALSMPRSSGRATAAAVDDDDVAQNGRDRNDGDDPRQMMMLKEIYDMVIGMTKTMTK